MNKYFNNTPPVQLYRSKQHNNRKMTKGRKQARHIMGGRRGYVPNHIIHATKMVEMCENKLKQLKNQSGSKQIKNSEKIIHLQRLINKYKRVLN